MFPYPQWTLEDTMPANAKGFKGVDKFAAGVFLRERRMSKGREWTHQRVADLTGMPNDNYMVSYEKGKVDWRKSDYVVPLMHHMSITAKEAREKLGMEIVIDHSTPDDFVPHAPGRDNLPVKRVRYGGEMRPGMYKRDIPATPLLEIPLELVGKYHPEELFVIRVVGDTMTCEEARRGVPEGAFVVVHSKLAPRTNDLVIAWIPSAPGFDEGLGALQVYNRKHPEVVLESYNPRGPRFGAQTYPDMTIQGVYIGHWVAGRRG
jgi:SOS-response transcriptional repressor LexA